MAVLCFSSHPLIQHPLPVPSFPQPIDEFSPVPSVSRDWQDLARSDEVWLTFYRYKFLRNNTVMASMPERPPPVGGVGVPVEVMMR